MLTALSRSKFRSRFRLDGKDRSYIERSGLDKIRSHARDFVISRIAPAFVPNYGRQTPMRGHPVFKAQHATATCCRSCLERWYNIPHGRSLTDRETDSVVSIIMEWIDKEVAA